MREQIYSVGDLRAIIAPIAARHGVERIYLFGSYARGEATKNSDVDLRVDKGNLRGMFALGALYMEYDNKRTRSCADIGISERVEEKSELELFRELYELQNNQDMTAQQEALVEELIRGLKA